MALYRYDPPVLKHGLLLCLPSSFSLPVDESSKSDRGKEPLTKVAQSESALIGGEKHREQVYFHSGEIILFCDADHRMLCEGQCNCSCE